MIIIYLGYIFLYTSSHLGGRQRAVLIFHLRCCSRWGLHSQYVTILLVSSYLAFSSLPACRRLFSVALSLRLPSLGVTQHHCSLEPGLSSCTFFRICTCDYLAYFFYYFTAFCSKSQSYFKYTSKFLYMLNYAMFNLLNKN